MTNKRKQYLKSEFYSWIIYRPNLQNMQNLGNSEPQKHDFFRFSITFRSNTKKNHAEFLISNKDSPKKCTFRRLEEFSLKNTLLSRGLT